MNLHALTHFEQLKRIAPFPWYLDQCNTSGVCVKDCRGGVVFYEDFGTIPDEMPSHQADGIRDRAVALAQFLVELTSRIRP